MAISSDERGVTRLHVNIDHVATLRNARGTTYPDPVTAALACLGAGAHGITAHLREDRRHVKDDDIHRLRAEVKTTFNLEMAATEEMTAIATRVKPDVVTLVPERREERTTEGGLDVVAGGAVLRARVEALQAQGIRVSLFIAADPAQIDASRGLGVEQVELHTGDYAHEGEGSSAQGVQLRRLADGAARAHKLGLEVAAGHGLTCGNVVGLMTIPEIVELNIGHALVADAVFVGLPQAVRAMNAAIALGVGRRGERRR